MKKGLASKLNLLAHPTYLLIFLTLGLIVSVNLPLWLIYLSFYLTFIGILLVLFKIKSGACLVFLGFGILIGSYHLYSVDHPLPSGCDDAKVLSRAKKFKTGFVYKIKGSKEVLLYSQSDDFKIADKVRVCFGKPLLLEARDRRYLLSQLHSQNLMDASEIKLLEPGKGVKNYLELLSDKFAGDAAKLFSGDQGTLAYGVIFGGGDFSKELKNDFKRSGTTHIVAVSGYNVSIITAWMFDFLRQISKNFSGIFSVLALVGFYFITGGSASVLRASVMGVIILLTKFIGRKVSPLHLLMLAASLILAFNPFALYDWGFQLSFLATAGLFFLAPAIESLLSRVKFNKSLIKTFSETIGAQIFVLPILVANFGSFSIISPLTNLLILPLIPLLMSLVFISLIGFTLYHPLGIFLSGITKILLAYVIWIVKLSSLLPFASLNYKLDPLIAIPFGYGIIILLTYYLRRRYLVKSKQNI